MTAAFRCGYRVHPASYPVLSKDLALGVKRLWFEAIRTLPPTAEVKNVCNLVPSGLLSNTSITFLVLDKKGLSQLLQVFIYTNILYIFLLSFQQ
jgi:phage head maturation protease